MKSHSETTSSTEDPVAIEQHAGALLSLTAGAILAIMCTIVATTGTSQQWFEVYSPARVYSAALVAAASTLRRIIFLDDIFIATYATATVLFIRTLQGRSASPLFRIALAAALIAAALDLVENHHILAMLRMAEAGVSPSDGEIAAQMVASSTKWILGHIAFAVIGIGLPSRTPHALRWSLIAAQLPIGVLAWTQTDHGFGQVLEWVRYGNILAGFVFLGLLMLRRATPRPGGAAIGSSAPA